MSNRLPYHRKSPSRLPRIDTPPEHDAFRSSSDLRRDSFGRVPPVLSGRYYDWPFNDSPIDLDREPLNLLKGKNRVRYVEEPEILQGRTPHYSSSNVSSYREEPQSPASSQTYDVLEFNDHPIKPPYHQHHTTAERKRIPKIDSETSRKQQTLQPLKKPEHEELVYEDILREILKEEAKSVTKSYVREFAKSHLQRAAAYDIMMHLVEEIVIDLGPVLTDEAMHDALTDLIYEDILNSCTSDIVTEAIVEHQKEMIDRYAKETLFDGMLLDSLLSKLTKQGRAFTNEETEDLLIDDLILKNLLEQFFFQNVSDNE